MDNDMIISKTDAISLDDFLHSVQRRIWSVRFLEAGRTSLWYAGFMLAALAAIHLLIIPISIQWLATIIGVLVLLPLLQAMRQRPSIEQCAARADQAFGGQALMTTAVEYQHLSRDTDNFATRTVLRQADSAAQSWFADISQRFSPSSGPAIIIAAIPLFVATILLSLPGADESNDVHPVTNEGAPRIVAGGDDIFETDKGDAAALRRLVVDESSVSPPSSSDDQSTTTMVPAQIDAAGSGDLPTISDRDGDLGGVAGLAGNDGDLPGNAMARSADPLDMPMTPARFQDRENVEIQRTGPTFSAGVMAGTDYRTASQWHLNSPGIVQAAAAPDSLANSTILSPAQAAHARLYFEESGKDND